MNGIGVIGFLDTKLKTITALGNRVFLGQTVFENDQTLPIATVIGIDSEIKRLDCKTHSITDTLIVEGHFAASSGDVLTPGHALLAAFQTAIRAADCDYTYDGQLQDLTFTGRRVFPRDDGSAIGVCQLKLVARYNEDF